MARFNEKYLGDWKSILLKFVSNFVTVKLWITAIASVAMFKGLMPPHLWAGIVAFAYGAGKLTKMTWIKNTMRNGSQPTDESSD